MIMPVGCPSIRGRRGRFGTALVSALIAGVLLGGCGASPHADIVLLGWPDRPHAGHVVADRLDTGGTLAASHPPPAATTSSPAPGPETLPTTSDITPADVALPSVPSTAPPQTPPIGAPTPPAAGPIPSAAGPTAASAITGERLAAAMSVPTSRLSWVCRIDGSTSASQRRHDDFVHNVAVSHLPAVSRSRVLAQLPMIEANLDTYCAAERLTGVPALVLAAIHYREANNDPARSVMSGELLGAENPDTHRIEGTNLLDNTILAAEHLVSGAAEIYGVRVDRTTTAGRLAYAVAAYNRGGRYCRADQMHPMLSPYVAAGLVDANVGMIWPDLGSDDGGPESWGEPPSVRGRPDQRLGVLALMRGLGSEITAPAFEWNTDEVAIPCR